MGVARKVNPGDVFSRVTIIKEVAQRRGVRRFLCKCKCGKQWEVSLVNLVEGHTKSCGCLKKERTVERLYIHGKSGEKIYVAWMAMKMRCFNKNNPRYSSYGGRGITVCEEWLNFQNFYDWAIKNGYKPGLSIERVDNDGSYDSANCTWIPRENQTKNTRKTRLIEYNGAKRTLKEWGTLLGVSHKTLSGRLYRGWSDESIISTPFKRRQARSECND